MFLIIPFDACLLGVLSDYETINDYALVLIPDDMRRVTLLNFVKSYQNGKEPFS